MSDGRRDRRVVFGDKVTPYCHERFFEVLAVEGFLGTELAGQTGSVSSRYGWIGRGAALSTCCPP